MNTDAKSPSSNTTWCPLAEYAFIEISGPDAESFLQGQCTNDFAALTNGESNFGAHCNPKGRMISSFLALKLEPGTFVLRVHTSLVEIASAALKKYMVFSKSKLNNDLPIKAVGLLGENAKVLAESLQTRAMIKHSRQHSETCYELWVDEPDYQAAVETLNTIETTTSTRWQQALFSLGIAEVQAAHSEVYLPQELNFDRIGAVNFKKGCYTGQEIIARLHYRGKMKKHMYCGTIDDAINTSTPDELRVCDLNTDKDCGTITHTSRFGTNNNIFLALIDDEAVAQNNCALSHNKQAKIQWLPLPYAIP